MPAGVYKITNAVNSKIYIGSSIDVERRITQHKTDLRACKHCNRYLQSSWSKHGEDNFLFEVIEECLGEKDALMAREQHYLDTLLSYKSDTGYNIRPVAATNLGVKLSAETCAKIAACKRGRTASVETRAKMSAAHKGRKQTLAQMEALKKRNAGNTWNIGRKMSEEQYANHLSTHAIYRKPVVQMTLALEIVAEYSSAKEAIKALNNGRPNIQGACQKGSTSAGYYWRYKDDEDWKPAYSEPLSTHCKVQQYTLQGELIATWDSLMDAVRNTGIKKGGISQCCTGKYKQANGFIWKQLKPQRITTTA
jgi:group I intron endonuclease